MPPSQNQYDHDEQSASYTLSPDDEVARRLLSLMLAFANTTTPLTTSYIYDHYYPGAPQNEPKPFQRDRRRLQECGLRIVEVKGEFDRAKESSWAADETSFAQSLQVDPDDLRALDLALFQLVVDPTFVQRQELRRALSKINLDYATTSETYFASPTLTHNKNLSKILSASAQHHPLRVTYLTARGESTERTLAVYGEFGFRSHIYFVAADLDENFAPCAQPHSFRDDRFKKVQVLHHEHYEIPAGFDATTWRKLPFQIGELRHTIQLLVDKNAGEDAQQAAKTYGNSVKDEQGVLWTVEAADLEAAARWSIAEGITPQQPAELVAIWKRLLEEALG